MRLLNKTTLLTASLLLISGCASPVPSSHEKKVTIDPTLPVIELTDHGIITDMKTVAFEWKSITDSRVKGIYVYKNEKDENISSSDYKVLKSRFRTHYVDRDVEPGHRYFYSFKTFSSDAEGKMGQMYSVETLPVLPSVSWIQSIQNMPRSAKIIWRPHPNGRVESYIVERKTLNEEEWNKLATVEGRLNAEYLDTDLDDDTVYLYRVRVKTYDGIVSAPSEIVKVITQALPKGIEHIKATNDLPKRIEIDWEKSNAKDFYKYFLYRSDDIDGKYEVIAKLYNNHFTDKIENDGEAYLYKVSVVNKDGLESKHDKIIAMGMSLPKPHAPSIVEAKLVGSDIVLKWSVTDKRTTSFNITRKLKKGWFDEVVDEFKNVQGNRFVDKSVKSGSTYKYTIYSLDKNGLISEPSDEAVVVTPESKKIIGAPKQQEVEEVAVPMEEKVEKDVVLPEQNLDLNGI